MANRTCTQPGCDRPYLASGFCNAHYLRWKHGRAMNAPIQLRGELTRERFESLYVPEPNTGCWLWTGPPKGLKGYGGFGGEYAHRAAWKMFVGPIPPETPFVLHHCDIPPCVNWVSHLWLGTQADNIHDMLAKNRGRWRTQQS